MVIIAEIFKTTIDELLMDSVTKAAPETSVYTSETIYDIDRKKHFDVNIGSASTILLSSGDDEKLHIKLSSETLENLDSAGKETEYENVSDSENQISVSGIYSEMVIVLTI